MEQTTLTKRYKIPQDVLMDILRILFANTIKHKIEGIREKENSILLAVNFTDKVPKHTQAKENIENILTDYSHYMKGLLEDGTLFMDEDEEDD